MTSLITGIGGMVGSHLAELLLKNGDKVVGIYYNSTVNLEEALEKATLDSLVLIECDVRYFNSVYAAILQNLPERIFHLAAQSLPAASLLKPQETFDINCGGTINVFESIKMIRKQLPHYNPKVVVAASSAQYGASLTPENTPIKEDAPLLPLHPYGASKVAQDLLTFQYYKSDHLAGIRARIFNTTGPRKTNDVCSDFTKRAVEIERGKSEKLLVGNITTKRAITDVRDLVIALKLLSEKGEPGEVYNISGEKVYEVREIIELIKKNSSAKIEIEEDPRLLRPTDEPVIFGDSAKLKKLTQWRQEYPIEQTIADMLEYWRKR
ncbi:MAG: GDP-mannose 4,6-dehydratase [Spirochaetes bacterium]|nr:GDP-mannose 4,6-dehydratase [Spirochaetota bacterium]